MTYGGAKVAAQSRVALGSVLERLQADPDIPQDVLGVASNIAHAVSALFEAEHASSDVDGKASVRHAMGALSQTMALLQDVRAHHSAIDGATRTLAEVMSGLFPLTQTPTHRPSRGSAVDAVARTHAMPTPGAVPKEAHPARSPQLREKLEANIGATTESNFYVGFSGDIAEGGVFVATYQNLPVGTPVELLITLPGGFSQTIHGSIRFVRDPMDMQSEPGMGVSFDGLNEAARALILRFVRKRPPLFYDV